MCRRVDVRSLVAAILGVAAGLAVGTPAADAAASSPAAANGPADVRVQDAFARPGANACSWTIGSSGIRKTLTFSDGSYRLSSFLNMLTDPAREYVAASDPSPEFQFVWDGHTLTGTSGGWTCASGSASQVAAGDGQAVRVDVALTRPQVRVVKHYVVYPHDALIREWVDYQNTDTTAHRLAHPSYLDQRVMGDRVSDVDLKYMYGDSGWQFRSGPSSPELKVQTQPLSADYERTFDSNDTPLCTLQGTACHGSTLYDSTMIYQAWFALWDRASQDGIYTGSYYSGEWAAPIGAQGGNRIGLSWEIPNYDAPLAAGGHVTMPQAFTGVYVRNLDDMTNRLLDFQYRYQWDYTRHVGAVHDLGFYPNGAYGPYGEGQDRPGNAVDTFGLAEQMRAMGVDASWHDWGWWDRLGNFNGEDFKLSTDYLRKYGMSEQIYMIADAADPDSEVYKQHPEWFDITGPGSNQGHACPPEFGRQLDLGKSPAEQWMQSLLIGEARKWGDFEWSTDGCFNPNLDGAGQLAYWQGYWKALKGFLDARPNAGYRPEVGIENLSFSAARFADATMVNCCSEETNGLSVLFPVDKLFPMANNTFNHTGPGNTIDKCNDRWNNLLKENPAIYGTSTDPKDFECARRVIDLYHYLAKRGLVGRWVRQYHPNGTGDPSGEWGETWFERLSRDRHRGVILYEGNGSKAPITMYPRGLDPERSYDVRYQLQSGSQQRTGRDLMTNGITLPSVAVGELIYLGLREHPGAGTDHTAPEPPGHLTATRGTNMGYPGVEVSWSPAHDDNWVSYYEVLRDGKSLGKVAKGTFYFDHTAGATPSATYAVRAVDGDGNVSPTVATSARHPDTAGVDDPADSITYTGNWSHVSEPGAGDGTLSRANSSASARPDFSCQDACEAFGSSQGNKGWSSQTGSAGHWSDIADYNSDCLPYSDGLSDCGYWHDPGTAGGRVSAQRIVPGSELLGSFGPGGAGDSFDYPDGVAIDPANGDVYLESGQRVLKYDASGKYLSEVDAGATPAGSFSFISAGVLAVDPSTGDLYVDDNGHGVIDKFDRSGKFLLDFDGHASPAGSFLQAQAVAVDPSSGDVYVVDSAHDVVDRYSSSGDYKSQFSGEGAHQLNLPYGASVDSKGNVYVVSYTSDVPGAHGVEKFTSSGAFDSVLDSGGSSGIAVDPADDHVYVAERWGSPGFHVTEYDADGNEVRRLASSVSTAWQIAVDDRTHRLYVPDSDNAVVDIVDLTFDPGAPVTQTARAWTAPEGGTVDVQAVAAKTAVGGDGVELTITKNDQPIWGPTHLEGDDVSGVRTDVANVAVAAGDVLRFVVDQGQTSTDDSTNWDPNVTYAGDPPPAHPESPGAQPSASWTFTGSQVTWYAQLGPNQAIAQVSIDGKPDGVINLLSPVKNESMPVYTKTFPSVGRHTITVQATGRTDSDGHDINVDGFRAVTAAPAVTEAGGGGKGDIAYDGSGWRDQADTRASGGALMTTSHAGDSATFAFTGRQVTWVGPICSACGEADVYLDGHFATRVDTFGLRGPDVPQSALFQHSWGQSGAHTIKVVAVGNLNYNANAVLHASMDDPLPPPPTEPSPIHVDSFQVMP